MILNPPSLNTNKLARKFAATILINQRSIFPRRYPSDTSRKGLLHRLRTLLILNALNMSSFFSTEEQEKIQELRLQQLFSNMYTQSPFWKKYLKKSGVSNPLSIRLKELSYLPLMSKDELRAIDPLDLYVDEKSEVIHRTTTGTTGEPFHTQWSAQDFQQWIPCYLRAIPEDIFPINLHTLRQQFFILTSGFQPKDWPLGHLARQWDIESIDSSRRYVVHGNASGLEGLADEKSYYPFRLALIFAASEHLSEQGREKLEKYFKAPVRRYYAMRDCGWIGWECGYENNMLHINTERFILETIDDETGKSVFNAPGEIVITILDSWRMPRIRYRTGDIGILRSSPCQCGITLPVIKFIGRIDEFLILPSGKKIPALQIQSAIWNIIMLTKRIQIKQYSSNKIHAYLVPQPYATAPNPMLLSEKLKRRLQETIKERLSIEVSIVSEVPEQKGEKHPFFVPIGGKK